MSDPFRFRENKVAWQTDYEGGCRWITAHCDTPTGVISAYGEDLRGVMDELYCEFRASVRNATAHQRLAWMAAAQADCDETSDVSEKIRQKNTVGVAA